IEANLDLERKGGVGGAVALKSLLRAGDGLDARFDVGLTKHLKVDIHASEDARGALAGMIGLPADKPLRIEAHADGVKSQGRFHLRIQSGDQTPAMADGAWTPQWTSADARVSMAASTFTTKYLHEIGPQLDLSIRGRGAADG